MICPECGFEIERLPCEHCERWAAEHEREFQRVIEEFSLIRGNPTTDAERASLDKALRCLQERLNQEQFEGTVPFNPDDLLRSRNWWYVPYRWIGCIGFIVSSENGYVNWLGSGSGIHLRECLWGHERGIFCDLVDFTFAQDTDPKLAVELVGKFHHMHPNSRGVLPRWPVPYRDSEIQSAFSIYFPTFSRHFIWSALPELARAYKEGLRFTCRLAK